MASRSCRAAFAQMIFQRQVFGKGSCAVVLAGVIDYMARSSREEIRLEITTFCTGVITISFFAARTGIMRQAPCPNSAATPLLCGVAFGGNTIGRRDNKET